MIFQNTLVKRGISESIKSSNILPNAIIAYFDSTPQISLSFKTSSNNNEGTYIALIILITEASVAS